MPISLTNTLTGRKEVFVPGDPARVTMYVCGPTVYNYPHIGNARPAVVFDLLYRLLQHRFPRVTYARNITDVDDKINEAARIAGLSISEIANTYIRAYHADMAALNCLEPDIEPRATAHILDMIAMIEALIARGHAYVSQGHALFHVPSYPDYGGLSKRSQEELLAGARVEVAPYKKDPSDFVLWKPSPPDLPGWDSPWGRGRPGWHIECSAMVEKHLGHTVDIHGGGQDLIFPHHENEAAQGACAHGGEAYCRAWMHNGFVNVNREKMSKSLGNVLLVRDLLAQAPGEAIRLALMSAHYRQPLDWTDDLLAQSVQTMDKFYRALERAENHKSRIANREIPEEVLAALEDDLNTPEALAAMHQLAREANKAETPEEKTSAARALLAAGDMLGLLQQTPAAWFSRLSSGADEAEIIALVAARNTARAARNFKEADAIRDKLTAMNVIVEDHQGGTGWRYGSGG